MQGHILSGPKTKDPQIDARGFSAKASKPCIGYKDRARNFYERLGTAECTIWSEAREAVDAASQSVKTLSDL